MTQSPIIGDAMAMQPRTTYWMFRVGFQGMLRWVIVVAFLLAGAAKLIRPGPFQLGLLETGFFPPHHVSVLMYLIPIVECIAACAVGLRRFELPGLSILCFLSAAFAGFHTYLASNGIVVPCGCGGLGESFTGAGQHWFMAAYCAILFMCNAMLILRGNGNSPQSMAAKIPVPRPAPMA